MSTPYKTRSRSALARELLKEGKLSAHAIAKRTGLSVKTIYSTRWKMAQKQGLGAIKPQTPPQSKTGIAAIPPEFATTIDRTKKKSNNRRNAQLKRWAREREQREQRVIDDIIITLAPKRQTVWQRIKGFFCGA